MSGFQSTKIFLLMDILLIGVKKFLSYVPWTYVISDLHGEEIVGSFYEKERQKIIRKNLELKK